MTTAEARVALERMTAASTDPGLTADEITALLNAARRADSYGLAPDAYADWAATSALTLGGVAVPTTRNGHRYVVTTAGTSGSSEPTWPTDPGATVADGSVVWTESGTTVWTPTWALAAAAAEGWRWKLGKTSDRFAFTDAGGASLHPEQVITTCERMIKLYSRQGGGVVRVARPLSTPSTRGLASNADG
jgi:hypothetical protein